MREQTQTQTLDLGKLLLAWLGNGRLLAAAALVGALAALVAALLWIPPRYQSSVMFYVNNKGVAEDNSGISGSDLTTSRSLVNSYIVLLNTGDTLLDVIREAEVTYTPEELEQMLQTEVADGTELFRILVTASRGEEAQQIAEAVSRILPEKIAAVMEGATARVVDPAVVPVEPVSPGYGTVILLGGVCGLVLAMLWIFAEECVDGRIRRAEDIPACGGPVLAKIGKRDDAGEAYLTLGLKLICLLEGKSRGRVIGIREENGQLLPGLARALSRQGKHTAVVWETGLFRDDPGISRIAPEEIRGGTGWSSLELEALRQKYDFILLPLSGRLPGEMLAMGRQTDGVLLTALQHTQKISCFQELARELSFVGADILGTVYLEKREKGWKKPYRGRYLK